MFREALLIWLKNENNPTSITQLMDSSPHRRILFGHKKE
jgi:intein-encoded DNA endonuclease-like protein